MFTQSYLRTKVLGKTVDECEFWWVFNLAQANIMYMTISVTVKVNDTTTAQRTGKFE